MRSLACMILAGIVVFHTPAPAQQKAQDVREWIQPFNGRDLAGWTMKFTKHDLGENFRNTFRVADGLLRVRYDQWPSFDGEFGHIFCKDPFSYYLLAAEYRFVGEQVSGGAGMGDAEQRPHAAQPGPSHDAQGSGFPIAREIQLLGGLGKGPRTTANLCTPGVHVVMKGQLHTPHCTNSSFSTYDGDQCVSKCSCTATSWCGTWSMARPCWSTPSRRLAAEECRRLTRPSRSMGRH